MLNKKEIIGSFIVFIIVYMILYADHRLHHKCDCNNCYLSSNKISLKIPFLIMLLSLIIYKISEKYLKSNICGSALLKQDIITEMADF